jgi:Skp family chaperone for outer membrane proteins
MALTWGLGLGSLVGLIGRAFGQTPVEAEKPKPDDPKPGFSFGTVDLGEVFKRYEKVKVQGDEFKADVAARQKELLKLTTKAQQEADRMATLPEGSEAHKRAEAAINAFKEEYEKGRTRSEEEFTRREARMLVQLYKEIQKAIGAIARQKNLDFVFRVPDLKDSEVDLKEAMALLQQPVLYANTSHDLTGEVVSRLNRGS